MKGGARALPFIVDCILCSEKQRYLVYSCKFITVTALSVVGQGNIIIVLSGRFYIMNNGYETNGYMENSGEFIDPERLRISQSLERAGYVEDDYKLNRLGFTPEEVTYFRQHVSNMGVLTQSKLAGIGVQPNYINLFTYMFKLSCYMHGDSVDITDPISYSEHLAKLFKFRTGAGLVQGGTELKQTFGVTEKLLPPIGLFKELPRRAQIVNIPADSKLSIYDSSNYKFYDKLYCIKPGTNIGQNVSILTDKQPKLAYREKRGIDDIIEIKGIDKYGVTELSVNREYTKVHNVFYVLVRLGKLSSDEMKKYGYAYLVAGDGTIITVYVSTWKPSTQAVKKVNSLRVCDVGYFDYELRYKVCGVMQKLANDKSLNIKLVQYYPQTETFETFSDTLGDEDEIIIE